MRRVMTIRNSSRPIARVFRATAAPGCRDELLQRFHSSSAALVSSKAGCLKYRILEPVDASAPEVVFESVWRDLEAVDDVENLSQIWAVAPALVKLALRDVQPSQKDKEPPWKRIAKGRRWAM